MLIATVCCRAAAGAFDPVILRRDIAVRIVDPPPSPIAADAPSAGDRAFALAAADAPPTPPLPAGAENCLCACGGQVAAIMVNSQFIIQKLGQS